MKRLYTSLPPSLRPAYVAAVMAPFELRMLAKAVAAGEPQRYVRTWTEYRRSRGMSRWHDLVDWVGGSPFEVAQSEAVVSFCRARDLAIECQRLTTSGGCSKYPFRRISRPGPSCVAS